MSKAKQRGEVVNFRLEPAMMRAIELELGKRNSNPLCVYWTKSEWIRQAIADKLAHSERSRRKRTRPAGKSIDRPKDMANDDADNNG